ncbi:MAG: threonine/serine exporter family protein [Lachnospiraceae bacterium]|nr:threonine/serine exporter family protein [Lachnospiraceae bacterium]
MAIEFIIAVVATLAFAILYNVPREQWIFGGLTGAISWLVYRLASIKLSLVIATFLATLVVVFIARTFAVTRKTPVIIFLVCGIFPLVPGVGIYYTAYYFIMSDFALAGAKGTETLKLALAIALGIICILSLPQKLFLLFERKNKQ